MKTPVGYKCPQCGKINNYHVVETRKIFYPNGEVELSESFIEMEGCGCETHYYELEGDSPQEFMLGFLVYEETEET